MALDYFNPLDPARHPQRKHWLQIVGWCVGGLLLFMLAALVLMPSGGRARESGNRVKCASCLREIGQAALLYANDHGGAFPSDLIALYRHGNLTPEIYTCPSSDLAKAAGATQEQVVSSMLSGDHFSYTWTGSGITTATADVDIILSFDLEPHVPQDDETTTGINVLLADGSVEFVDEPTAKAVRAQFVAGVRPLRMPTTSPSTAGTAK